MKKKKSGGNSKTYSTIILVFVVCCLMATNLWAARKIDFYSANAGSFIEKLNQDESTESESIGPLLGLSQDGAFTLLRQKTDFNGVTHYRYQQTYKGISVWGIQTIISRSPANQVVRLHGAMVLDIPKDIKKIPSSLDPLDALNKMEDQHKKIDKNAQWIFRNEEYGTYIYLDKREKAHLCYVVSFFADTDCGNPSRPVFFVDVKTGKVIHSFDSLAYAYDGTGPGGNLKIGYYYYGTDYPPFGVTVAGSTCTMNWDDCKTVDLNHGTSGTTPYSYTCYENTHEEINGAYCPLNDAQYFGQVVFDTYMDWYGLAVLPFQLTLRCHYSNNYENAFWDGSTMTFGDGYTTFYPLVSLDVVAHEVSHGFTDYHSDLIYSGQSGGINESFSDMAGEAAKYYMRGTNDFMCGYDIFKNPTGALRYLYDPPLDGISIDHVDDYYEGMDVHYSSGIFNKAFYLIATSPGWNTRMAFDIFVKANTDYWGPSTNFQQGAEGALDGALDYGYSCQDVVNAFAQVGINCTCPCPPPEANFVGSPTSGIVPLTVNFTDQSTENPTSWDWTFEGGNLATSDIPNPTVTYNTSGTYDVTLTVTNACGSDTETKEDYITVNPCLPQVDADFGTCFPKFIKDGDSINFTDQSTGNPTSWSWTFEGGTPATSTDRHPTGITYDTEGTYTVSLTATNACGSDTETKTGYINVSDTAYCVSWGDNYWLWITRVEVADLDNSSGQDECGYGDYTHLTAHLTQGKTFPVSLENNFGWNPIYSRIWIDYNGDFDFDDAGEKVFEKFGGNPLKGSISVPCSTIIGDTRMRVTMGTVFWPPCGPIGNGEVEDYTVNISPNLDLEYKTCYIDVFPNISTSDYRRAVPCTMPEDGTIKSVTMYHEAGTGSDQMILAVYDGEVSPQNKMAVTPATLVSTSAGWQTIELPGPLAVTGGSTIWLAWVYENNPGIRYTDGSPGRYQSPYTWLGGMPDPFGTGTQADYIYSIYATYTKSECTVGYSDVFPEYFDRDTRRAQPFTMPEDGTIDSISMYHDAGTGSDRMILAVYEGEGFPQYRIGVTVETPVDDENGDWQDIALESPVFVEGGTNIWLAWVYESVEETTSGIRRQSGFPGAFVSDAGWPLGMPEFFGCSEVEGYIYSIYATYTPGGGGEPTYKTVGTTEVYPFTDDVAYRQAMPFTMPETGYIKSVSMYHSEDVGDTSMILGVYAGEGTPQDRLALTAATDVCNTTGWQTIELTSPVQVTGGTPIWLAWVYESNPGIRKRGGLPGEAYQSTDTWPDMPNPFGFSSQTSAVYSIFANYTVD